MSVRQTIASIAAVVWLQWVAGCSAPVLHARLTDAEFSARAESKFSIGQSREEVEHTLNALDLADEFRIVRAAPPGILQRVWEPGGFWIDNAFDIAEWVDLELHFDDQWILQSWQTKRHTMRYDNRRPYSWDPADGPPRNWPLPPLPPREWRTNVEPAAFNADTDGGNSHMTLFKSCSAGAIAIGGGI